MKFYNVAELCADRLSKITEFFPNVNSDHFSTALFYRFFIPHLLPQEIEKAIYLDSDIIVNFNITELWQVEIGDKPFGAIPELYQVKDKEASIERTNKAIASCREGFINPEDYFNSGVLLMNLKFLRNEEETILAGIKFRSEHPTWNLYDQEILNYCFSSTYLKLPVKFNRFVKHARAEDEWTVEKKIYHYADSKASFILDTRDPFNRLFMDYFIKTPWVDDDTKVALSNGIPSRKSYFVSVIIPMYNAGEFIRDCLDSLVIQTFQSFEIIIIDDCSTDESVNIVKEYMSKFDRRLKLVRTKKNSGGGAFPRNIGLELARGDYVYFLDADDMIVGTALETLYLAAIFYDADVVYTSSYYNFTAPNDGYVHKDKMGQKIVSIKTAFTVDDPNKNLSRLLYKNFGNFHTPWTTFCRRDFLLENRLFFPKIPDTEDFIWIINLYCHAKRFLRISAPLNLHRRYNDNSITRKVRTSPEQCLYWFQSLVNFAVALRELERETEVLSENPLYGLLALKKHFNFCLNKTEEARKELDGEEIYKILHSEFIKNNDALAVMLPFLFHIIDNDKKANANYNANYVKPINKFKRYFTARVDVKLITKGDGELQVVSVSDESANIKKAAWLPKNEIGYFVQSYVGSMEIVAKATVEGKIRLNLKSMDVRNPDDNKRIPYWIDYTNLTVNDKIIFDKVTPAWHDKAYNYTLDAKAGDEIKIQVEWLPHLENVLEVKLPQEKVVEPIDKKFMPYLTARLDVKLTTEEGGDFKILSVSDKQADIKEPAFLQKGGVGYVIQSHKGSMEIVAKATTDGKFTLSLRSMDVRNPKDNTRIPYWIDYTRLTVNAEKLFDEVTPVWHDKPYKFTLNVKAGDEIKIQVEWQPHRSDT